MSSDTTDKPYEQISRENFVINIFSPLSVIIIFIAVVICTAFQLFKLGRVCCHLLLQQPHLC